MRATQEWLQKPQLVVATKGEWGARKPQGNEEGSSEEEDWACKAMVVAEGNRGRANEITRGKHVKGDMASPDPLKTHQTYQIPKNLQSPPLSIHDKISSTKAQYNNKQITKNEPIFI